MCITEENISALYTFSVHVKLVHVRLWTNIWMVWVYGVLFVCSGDDSCCSRQCNIQQHRKIQWQQWRTFCYTWGNSDSIVGGILLQQRVLAKGRVRNYRPTITEIHGLRMSRFSHFSTHRSRHSTWQHGLMLSSITWSTLNQSINHYFIVRQKMTRELVNLVFRT